MFDRGYWRIFSWRGAPVRLHWTLPVGAFVFGGLEFVPAFWLGFTLLVFAHELGHAMVVRKFGHRVSSIDITGIGGMCRWSGSATAMERALIAWGGVMAQSVLLVAAAIVAFTVPAVARGWLAGLLSVFLWTNVYLMALNLIPIPPLDGSEAWKIIPLLRRAGGWGELRRALLPLPRRVREQAPWRRESSGAAPKARAVEKNPGQGMAPQELADLLKKIGDQAGEARKGDKSKWN